jgi:hypothetical protein
MGSPVVYATPLPFGPRNCDQFKVDGPETPLGLELEESFKKSDATTAALINAMSNLFVVMAVVNVETGLSGDSVPENER